MIYGCNLDGPPGLLDAAFLVAIAILIIAIEARKRARS